MMGASGGATAEPLYIESLFSTYLYTGNSSTQTITNGIDLAGKGGLVWTKSRGAGVDHALYDTARGNNFLSSNTTSGQSAPSLSGMSFSSSGYNLLGADGNLNNTSFNPYVSWTFRKAPKFFDVVTYTGDGANRTIAHNLGSVPGCIIVKRTDTAADWQVYHRSLANTEYVVLNTTAAKATGATRWNSTTPTDTVFSLGTDTTVNANGGTYVAYLFAHNAGGFGLSGTDNVISCGALTTNGTTPTSVNLGWEPQFLLVKASSGYYATNNPVNWFVVDAMRGMTATTATPPALFPNSSGVESATGFSYGQLSATGFSFGATDPTTWIYIAIRRPNKPPTSGTQVCKSITRVGTQTTASVTGVGFPPDLVVSSGNRNGAGRENHWFDRLRGANNGLRSSGTYAENAWTNMLMSFDQDGYSLGSDVNSGGINYDTNASPAYINWIFRRAPGFFDVVCYTGNGGVGQQWPHSLGVQPELIIQKARSTTGNWVVAALAIEGPSSSPNGLLNTTGNLTSATYGLSCKYSTATTFYTDFNTGNTNVSGTTYVAYLFATKAGISKVFSYTGNGSSQTINCGFTNGARFVLIKRSDSTGNWLVADTARGLVSGNDPVLYLNSTAAEVTNLDWIDPDSTGFTVVQEATANANVNNATYIGLAIA